MRRFEDTKFPEPTLSRTLRKVADGRSITPEEAWDLRELADWLDIECITGIGDLDELSKSVHLRGESVEDALDR